MLKAWTCQRLTDESKFTKHSGNQPPADALIMGCTSPDPSNLMWKTLLSWLPKLLEVAIIGLYALLLYLITEIKLLTRWLSVA